MSLSELDYLVALSLSRCYYLFPALSEELREINERSSAVILVGRVDLSELIRRASEILRSIGVRVSEGGDR